MYRTIAVAGRGRHTHRPETALGRTLEEGRVRPSQHSGIPRAGDGSHPRGGRTSERGYLGSRPGLAAVNGRAATGSREGRQRPKVRSV
jgi:hypothetical protein